MSPGAQTLEMKRHRSDLNQQLIVNTLRECGCLVESLSQVGNGVPDLLVWRQGNVYLLECKQKNGKLTPEQEHFHLRWKSKQIHVVRTTEEALNAVGISLEKNWKEGKQR